MSEIEWFGPSYEEPVATEQSMSSWLLDVIESGSLSEETEGYLLGRGLKSSRIEELRIFEWNSTLIEQDAPDPIFCNLVPNQTKKGPGPRGASLNGRICIPLWGPRGNILGFEARSTNGPKINIQYRTPEAHWSPVFGGMSVNTMQKIWEGANIWIVEGIFDMSALEQILPKQDVALATLRARMSHENALFLSRFSRGSVNMAYDNDPTGRKQTLGYIDPQTNRRRWGALDILSSVGIRARDIQYRGGKDPGEIWDRGGSEALKKAFNL